MRSVIDSPNFKAGAFRNLSETSVMAEDASYRKMFWDFFNKPADSSPAEPLPTIKTNLQNLNSSNPLIIWFGHSSYLIHCNGLNILVDPVFDRSASPLPFLVKAFPGTNIYETADLPPIHYLVITHNHYDHLNKSTIIAMAPALKKVIAPLGLFRQLNKWGIDKAAITELDWWEDHELEDHVRISATPARHFSGRGIKRGGSLWNSYWLSLFGKSIYIGGDSGYDTHFRAIRERYGAADLSILECGQYNTAWPHIHMMPEEVVQAHLDLGAKALLPVHWGKFALAYHGWKEPVNRVTEAAKKAGILITTPLIGEPLIIDNIYPSVRWWEI